MRLPNADQAIVEIAKIRDYCLNPIHPRGKHKARVFRSALRLEQKDSELLRQMILGRIGVAECSAEEEDEYGKRFIAVLKIEWQGREALVRTG